VDLKGWIDADLQALTGRIANAVVLVEDHERQTPLLEVVADRQPRLASADDHGSEMLINQPRQLSIR